MYIPKVFKTRQVFIVYMSEQCLHDWVEVVTYKQIYRTCIVCNEKNVKNGDKWEIRVSDNLI